MKPHRNVACLSSLFYTVAHLEFIHTLKVKGCRNTASQSPASHRISTLHIARLAVPWRWPLSTLFIHNIKRETSGQAQLSRPGTHQMHFGSNRSRMYILFQEYMRAYWYGPSILNDCRDLSNIIIDSLCAARSST